MSYLAKNTSPLPASIYGGCFNDEFNLRHVRLRHVHFYLVKTLQHSR